MQSHRNCWKLAATLATGLTWGTSAAQAQGALLTEGVVLAYSEAAGGAGDVVNGLGGAVYGGSIGLQTGLLDENGTVFFFAQMQGGGVTGANDRAIFRGTTKANVVMLIRSQDPAPGLPGLNLLSIGTSLRSSANGRILIPTDLQDPMNNLPTTADSAWLGGAIGNFGLLSQEGDAAPGTVGATMIQSLGNISQENSGMNRSGRILIQSSLANGDTTSAAPPAIANDQGWWTGLPGSLELVQRKGDTPAGAPATHILSFGQIIQMNASGQVVFNTTLSTVLGGTPATSFTDSMLTIYSPGPSRAKIVREGDPAPGTVGATFNIVSGTATPLVMGTGWTSDIGSCAFNASGQVGAWWNLFNGDVVAPVTSGGYGNDAALYRASASGMTMIFRKGSVAPGTGGAAFSGVPTAKVCMNNSGKFAVQGILSDTLIPSAIPPVTASNDTGIWVGDEFGMTLVMREGDPAPFVAGGGTIASMINISPFLFNDLGQVLFPATITGNTNGPPVTSALYSWDPVLGLTLQLTNQDLIEVQSSHFRPAISFVGIQFNNGDDAPLTFNHTGKFVLRLNHSPTAQTLITGQVHTATPFTSFCFGDGTGVACPCGNTGTAGHGCASSSYAGGAILSAAGVAGSSGGTDTLALTASNIPGPGLFFQSNGLAPTPINFGDGHLCASVGIIRLGVVFPTSGVASYPGGLSPAPIHTAGGPISSGDTKHYQCWYRSQPGLCSANNYDLTQGLSILWGP